MFKIVSAGWQCADWMERTLLSVEMQTNEDWEITVAYDPSTDNGAEIVEQWCAQDSKRRHYSFPATQQYALRNQWEAINSMWTEPDDIIIFLDLDGDQLAHPSVLDHLLDYYKDGTLVTYGSYRPIPDMGTHPAVMPFPPGVAENNSYRQHILSGGQCCFNHLRTMKGLIYNAIPLDRFKVNGEWLASSTDYATMIPALELAGGRYKCITEVLLLYNHANPLADNIMHPHGTHTNTQEVLSRPALQPLPL